MDTSDKAALIPIAQKQVVFYGDTLVAVLVQPEPGIKPEIYVPVKPLADALGLDWAGQYQRINRDEVLAEQAYLVRIDDHNPQGGRPDQLCLPLEFIPGWLFGLQASRVKPELRDKIILFRRECYRVLAEAFQEGRLTAEPPFSELLQRDSPAAQAYRMATAVMELARHQLLLESRLETQEQRLDNVTERLEMMEAQLGDESRNVSQDQATQLSQAVKAIALEMSKRSGRNEYGGVYGEFYRKFGITSYKLLPARRFREAMDWLNQWYESLTGQMPF